MFRICVFFIVIFIGFLFRSGMVILVICVWRLIFGVVFGEVRCFLWSGRVSGLWWVFMNELVMIWFCLFLVCLVVILFWLRMEFLLCFIILFCVECRSLGVVVLI